MKKKFLATAVLSIAALTALAGCTTTNPTEQGTSDTGVVETAHAISLGAIGKGAHVTLSSTSAFKGTEVTITIALTDAENYILGEVKAGETVLTATPSEADKNVYTAKFTVGETDVAITVATTKIEEVELITHKASVAITGEGVYATLTKENAPAGAEIGLTVVLTDSEHYELESVKLGETSLTGTASLANPNVMTYTFLMPDSNAEVKVTTREVPPVVKDHKITAVGDYAVFAGLDTQANGGDEVTFSVTPKNGYTLSEIKVTYEVLNEETTEDTTDTITKDVVLEGNVNEGFSFVMPEADVKVEAIAVGNYYAFSVNKTEKTPAGVSKTKYDTENAISYFIDPITEAHITPNASAIFFQSGSKVRFVAKHNIAFTTEKFFVNGVEASQVAVKEEDKETALCEYEFTMPAANAEIKATLAERKLKVDVTHGAEVTVKTYVKNDEGNPEETAYTLPGQDFYIEAKCTDPEKIISSIEGKANTYKTDKGYAYEETIYAATDWFNSSTTSGDFKYVNDDTKVFCFTGKYSYDNTINITIASGVPAFKHEATGNYRGVELFYSSTSGMTTQKLGIYPSGGVTGSVKGTVSVKEDGNLLVTNGSNSKTMWYEAGNIVVSYSSNDSGINGTSYYNDMYFFSKEAASVEDTRAVRYIVGSTGGEEWKYVVEIYEGTYNTFTRPIAYFYVDGLNHEVIPNVSVEFTAGEKVDDADAAFTVKKGDRVLITKTAAPQE